jgi:hypothetical protein
MLWILTWRLDSWHAALCAALSSIKFGFFFVIMCDDPKAMMDPNHQKCFLPGCGKPVWPLMEYCGKTHADEGD